MIGLICPQKLLWLVWLLKRHKSSQFQFCLIILCANILIYSIFQFIDKRRSSYFFKVFFHNKRSSSHFFHHPNHIKIVLSCSPPKYHSMFCTSKDNNVTVMESRNAPLSYSSINYNTSFHRWIVSSATLIKSLDESDVPIDKCERTFANAFGVFPCITFTRDIVLTILTRTTYLFIVHM
jgi:hypothetical protein